MGKNQAKTVAGLNPNRDFLRGYFRVLLKDKICLCALISGDEEDNLNPKKTENGIISTDAKNKEEYLNAGNLTLTSSYGFHLLILKLRRRSLEEGTWLNRLFPFL